jgi:hypothetical protein
MPPSSHPNRPCIGRFDRPYSEKGNGMRYPMSVDVYKNSLESLRDDIMLIAVPRGRPSG